MMHNPVKKNKTIDKNETIEQKKKNPYHNNLRPYDRAGLLGTSAAVSASCYPIQRQHCRLPGRTSQQHRAGCLGDEAPLECEKKEEEK
jgi:hypothetical protein